MKKATGTPKPTPLSVLTDFLKAYDECDYEVMFNLTQKTWRENKTAADLKTLLLSQISTDLKNNTKKEYEIIENKTISKASLQITFKHDGKTRKVMLICETRPFEPSEDGDWGINPISFLKEW